ncbi:cryptochrome/photolyase family protein [Rhodococcus sp. MEB064]|uniref:cryptochrome/photolyase family protein n=1 Tax=Rhodococcus sp. MEB064 TaxID=1587522 RepID=UPI0005ABBE1F|nr:deoxyribodipyrimidine photo-lyase [Rhodococcus sp. MEB064]KIQ13795.1 deoxyribodipyrimidine photolyase [Rhodococcus sp. MEB064]
MSENAPSVLWFRRDLRLGDHPALAHAAEDGRDVLALFVLDEHLLGPSGPARRDVLFRSLTALNEQLGGRLLVVEGDPVTAVPAVAKAVGADAVHVSEDFGPYGRRRDDAVAESVDLVRTGSPYAVSPGRIRKDDGEGFKVFTPFYRRWQEHGWRGPADTSAKTATWIDPDSLSGGPARTDIPEESTHADVDAGEKAALASWADFRDDRAAGYDDERNRPDKDSTSRMSVHLKYGTIHPRTMLADLASLKNDGSEAYRRELCFRDFYGDILFRRPDSARENYDKRFDAIELDSGKHADELFQAWCDGRTGFPIVDAGMRQLVSENWMHNRVRMIVASFLVKDLHLPWWRGARFFLHHLMDGDIASNQHGWQWTAGTGTDASPYFRVFNPTTQGEKFDPNGDYVRRWVPELRGIDGKAVHMLKDGRPEDYPEPIVDHKHEREEALRRFAALKS